MRACFVCGADWECSHREPELLFHELRLRRSLEAVRQRAEHREDVQHPAKKEIAVAPLMRENRNSA